jgi:hypothetical protein
MSSLVKIGCISIDDSFPDEIIFFGYLTVLAMEHVENEGLRSVTPACVCKEDDINHAFCFTKNV